MGQPDTLFTWSETARSEFEALVDGTDASDRFRLALAQMIANGWGANRDKPVWALAGTLALFGETGAGLASSLDFLWMPANEVFSHLAACRHPAVSANESGSYHLKLPGGGLMLDRFRLKLLQKYLEFLITCDGFAHSGEVAALLDACLKGGLADKTATDTAVKTIARILYRYRADHFDDGHATSAFSILRAYLAAVGDVITDDTVFDFWSAETNGHFKTYQASYFALKDYVDALADARSRAAMRRAGEIDAPGLAGELSVDFVDPFDFEEADEEEGTGDITDDVEQAAAAYGGGEDATVAALKAIAESEVKLIKKREEMLAAPIVSAGAFGCSLPLATLRLLAFHPIQSALSNSLRTGKATLSLKERVTCIEARRYGVLMGEVGELEAAMTEWLKIAFAVRSEEATGNARADAIRAEGVQLLKARRSQSLAKPREELALAFARVERALMALARTLGAFRAAARGQAGPSGDLDAGFEADRAKFAAHLSRLYAD
ncbi:hypothetical protein [Jiella avicenniae]|uniref:Uncharacterized protein n=1 Tax=Jiella avicenniae TaxID=2907202 RepID=A0A9X1T638_9HYPH|nr:hypothetical protein [Jiella avicenniae]MCE7030206.1 hypothetical protein [Jiella avicenniae]